jgi:hypothetical protein
MKTSESVKEIFSALAAAQAIFPAVPRDSENAHLGSKYTDLATILETVRKPLSANGLALVQTSELRPGAEGSGVLVITTLIHTSGEWIRGELPMPLDTKDPRKSPPQQAAASFTFGRRHALMAILGIASEEENSNGSAPPSERSTDGGQVHPLTLDQARQDLAAVSTPTTCVGWRNTWNKQIQASPDRIQIQELFTQRLNELKKKDTPK